MLDRDRVPARLAERRPDRVHGLVVGKLTLVREPGDQRRGDGVGGGKHRCRGSRVKGERQATISKARPEVQHDIAGLYRVETRSEFLASLEIRS